MDYYQHQLLEYYLNLKLRLINNSRIHEYMKGFYWYAIVAVIFSFPGFLVAHFSINFISYSSTYVTVNFSTIFHYCFLGNFIIKVTPNRTKKIKYLRYLFWLQLFLLLCILTTSDITRTAYKAYLISDLGLSIFCIIYYYQLFQNLPTINLQKEPSFWIISGVFFAMTISTPILTSMEYLENKIPIFTYFLFHGFLSFAFTIMYLFFIKAFICTIQMRKA